MCGFLAQLVENRTGIAEVTGSNPVEALILFRLLLSSCLNWKINCDDHSSLSSTTGIRTHDLRDTGAILYQLSYEATHWERGQFIEFISSREE